MLRNQWGKGLSFLMLLSAIFLLVHSSQQLQAAGTSGAGFTVGCTGLTSRGVTINLNRDNTGTNQESFNIQAYDGNGTVIYAQTTSFIVGGGFVIPSGNFFGWSTQPIANPIIVVISSNAGNGHGEQTVYRQSGSCALLTATGNFDPSVVGLPDIANVDGTTSPAVPIGQVPPTAVGIDNVAELLNLAGYGIVNTPRLNMRTGAGVQYTRIAILDGGTELIMLGHNPAGTWWYVQVDDLVGWVSGDYVALRGNVQETHIVPPQGEIEPARFILYDDYPLYAGASGNSGILCTLPGNIEFPVVGRTAMSDWFQVQTTCNGTPITGWVSGALGALRTSGARPIPVTG